LIGFLRGALQRLAPDRVILDVGGVGYAVRVPLSTYYQLERIGLGKPVELHIHTHVREESLDLYGFATEDELRLFERLLGVSGVGPRLAQGVLSGMPPAEVLSALATGDAARLQRIPGVGRKTAERLVLELRDAAQEMVAAKPGEPAPQGEEQDLVSALVGLGYKLAQVERVVAAVRRDHPEAPFGESLRLALRGLSRV
jgi:Holliday junction DNA helicase RuvA